MPRDHRTSKEDFPLAEAQRLYQQVHSYQKVADTIGWSFAQTRRKLQAAVTSEPNEPTIVDVPVETVEITPTVNSAEDTALHSADGSAALVSIPDNQDIQQTTVQGYALDSAETLVDHETRLQVLESFVATLQAQAVQPSVQHITVQSRADSAYALHSAESVQTWDNAEDAKPERWNLSHSIGFSGRPMSLGCGELRKP